MTGVQLAALVDSLFTEREARENHDEAVTQQEHDLRYALIGETEDTGTGHVAAAFCRYFDEVFRHDA